MRQKKRKKEEQKKKKGNYMEKDMIYKTSHQIYPR